MTGSRHEPNSAATSATYATDPCLTKAVVDGEPKVGWPKRHDPVASAAAREHGLALNAAALASLLDEDQRAAFDERAGILEYDEGLPRAEAEALALSETRVSSDDWLQV